MACRLFSVKPLSQPMEIYFQLDPKDYNSIKYHFKFKKMHLKMYSAKWQSFLSSRGYELRRGIQVWEVSFNKYLISTWSLTHWSRDKMVGIFQTFLNAFSSVKMFELKFHWSVFLRVQLTISIIGSDNGLAPNHHLNQWWLDLEVKWLCTQR